MPGPKRKSGPSDKRGAALINDKNDPLTGNIINWLQLCFVLLEEGREEEILRDIFYRSTRGNLTDDYVDRVIEEIDANFEYEITHSYGYHKKKSGAETTPDFHRLGREARRALVEGLDRIMGYQAN